MPTKVLALSGPSGSGKSTLAALLKCVVEAEGWSVTLLHGDDYFLGPKMASYWTDENKDHPDAIDLPAVRSKLSRARQQAGDGAASALIIIEGFMVLQDSELMSLVDAALFLTVGPQTCLARRLARSVRTPRENEGLVHYFHRCVWPGYLQYTVPALAQLREASERASGPPLREVDGTAPVERVAADAVNALARLFPELAGIHI